MMADVSLKTLLDISLDAGREILDVYEQDISVETKDDNSSLTEATSARTGRLSTGFTRRMHRCPC